MEVKEEPVRVKHTEKNIVNSVSMSNENVKLLIYCGDVVIQISTTA